MPQELTPDPPAGSEPILTASPETRSPAQRQLDLEDMAQELGSSGSLFWDAGRGRELVLSEEPDEGGSRPWGQLGLHPHVQTLSTADVDACVALENAGFPENERCSREKFIYRLTTCPYLCLGLFSTVAAEPDEKTQAFHDAARPPDSNDPEHKSLLLGHVIATMTTGDAVTAASMDFPSTFPSQPDFDPKAKIPKPLAPQGGPSETGEPAVPKDSTIDLDSTAVLGDNPFGRTIAIHSVTVAPPFQKQGHGRTLLKAYLQRMESSGIADRAALLAHPGKVKWYVDTFSFEDKGESKVSFAGGGWHDLVSEFGETI